MSPGELECALILAGLALIGAMLFAAGYMLGGAA